MKNDPHHAIYERLYDEFAQLSPGDPLPSVRRMMARFEVSQVVIDRIMGQLRETYPIVSEVGRGSFMGEPTAAPSQADGTVIQCYLPDVVSSFIQDVVAAMEREATSRGFELRLRRYPWDRVPRRLDVSPDTAGVFLLPPSFLSATELAALESVTVPLVLLDSVPLGLRLHSVASDNAFGGSLAANHLLEAGLDRLAIISAEPQINSNVGARVRGFRRQCMIAGVAAPALLTAQSPMGASVADEAYGIMKRVLATGPVAFDGLFADSAASAMGAMRALREAGITIPDDLALVAFDDTPEARFMHPTITVIEQQLSGWATAAFDILADARAATSALPPRQVQIPPLLIKRESSRVIQALTHLQSS